MIPVGVSNTVALLITLASTWTAKVMTKQTKLRPHERLVITMLLVLEVSVRVGPSLSDVVMKIV